MKEKDSTPIPLENRLGQLQVGDRITVISSSTYSSEPKFQDGHYADIYPHTALPLGLEVSLGRGHSASFSTHNVFAGSSDGIESVIGYDGDDPYVVFHNSNVPFPFPERFAHRLSTPEGARENLDRKVAMGLGSRDGIAQALDQG